MKNLKIGNVLLIVLVILIAFFILNGGVGELKDAFTEDLRLELAENDMQLKKSIRYSEQLKDSIEYMHIQYMNDSYLKENFDEETTYWFVRHSYRTGEYSSQTSQNVIKFDGGFSMVDLYHKIQTRDSIGKRKFVNLDIVQQVSEKEYYKWLKFEERWIGSSYIPY